LSFGGVTSTEVGDFVWGSSISVAAEATVFDTATTIELVVAQLAFVTAFVALEVADTRFVEAVSAVLCSASGSGVEAHPRKRKHPMMLMPSLIMESVFFIKKEAPLVGLNEMASQFPVNHRQAV
jgi:hypothetical protein